MRLRRTAEQYRDEVLRDRWALTSLLLAILLAILLAVPVLIPLGGCVGQISDAGDPSRPPGSGSGSPPGGGPGAPDGVLTTVDDLLDPKTGDLVREVARVNDVFHMPTGDKGTFGKGGMGTKLQAVSTAVSHGIETIIAGGRKPEQLPALVAGGGSDTLRTRFAPNPPTH